MSRRRRTFSTLDVAASPSRRTLRAELLRLCARIGYSPPSSL
ncbi:MAG: capsid protein [Rhizobiaceae bacterium]|nr:capsid protein [Rhizobiaceae bacterium]